MTGRVQILTDNTAQFNQPDFSGSELITVLPADNTITKNRQGALRPGGAYRLKRTNPRLPTAANFSDSFISLGQATHEILVLTMSQSLGTTFTIANQVASKMNGSLSIQVLDSHTLGIGLGLLAQTAARLSMEGMGLNELQRVMRKSIARIYTLLCIPELEYLHRLDYLTSEQVQVGQMLGMMPLFTLDDGRLNLLDKVRSPRRLLEAFQDFVGEFETPQSVAFLKSTTGKHFRTNTLSHFVTETFPGVNYFEAPSNPLLVSLIGSKSTGVIVMEKLEI